jgi:hypothetical protein
MKVVSLATLEVPDTALSSTNELAFCADTMSFSGFVIVVLHSPEPLRRFRMTLSSFFLNNPTGSV